MQPAWNGLGLVCRTFVGASVGPFAQSGLDGSFGHAIASGCGQGSLLSQSQSFDQPPEAEGSVAGAGALNPKTGMLMQVPPGALEVLFASHQTEFLCHSG
jgi:hypothetical protein